MRKLLFALIMVSVASIGLAQLKDLKPGFNLFSSQQDIQAGQEAAAQVKQEQPVVQNTQLTAYLNNVMKRLSSTPHGESEFPYQVSAIASNDINAFALPGGPIFVYIGLIQEASNQSELAGVLAHEMSHVKLRHGTNQVSESDLIPLPFRLGEKSLGGRSLVGQLAQFGIGLGFDSVLLKMSRSHRCSSSLMRQIANSFPQSSSCLCGGECAFERGELVGGQGPSSGFIAN